MAKDKFTLLIVDGPIGAELDGTPIHATKVVSEDDGFKLIVLSRDLSPDSFGVVMRRILGLEGGAA